MLSFMRSLDDYVVVSVFHSAWDAFRTRVLHGCKDVEDLIAAHQEYLEEVEKMYSLLIRVSEIVDV